MKAIFFLFFSFLILNNAFCQDKKLYVITDVVNVREKPDFKAKIMGTLKLGDSVMVTDYSNHQSTATIDGVKKTANWVEIIYNYKEAYWVFGGALCEHFVNYQYILHNFNSYEGENKKDYIQSFEKLVKDSVVRFGGGFITFKAKNKQEIFIRELGNGVLLDNERTDDGAAINFFYANPSNNSIIEVMMDDVFYSSKIYINLETGKKFKFIKYVYSSSSISPDGKYIVGFLNGSKVLHFYDFNKPQNILKEVPFKEDWTNIRWLNNIEVEFSDKNLASKRVFSIIQMNWKK